MFAKLQQSGQKEEVAMSFRIRLLQHEIATRCSCRRSRPDRHGATDLYTSCRVNIASGKFKPGELSRLTSLT